MRRLARRPALLAAALYAVLAVAFVSPALMPDRMLSGSDYLHSVSPWNESRPPDVKPLGSNLELLDQTLQFEPFYRYTDESLPSVPLWNPHVMAGRPFHANAQSAIFSPFSAPAYVMPVPDALGWMAALKLFVAAFGAYLLARALGLRFAAALVAGLVYAFGLYFVAWVTWPLASVWAWMPWLLAAAELLVRRPGPLPAAGLSVLTALQFFGGHPESSFHVLFATLAFFVLRLVVHRRRASGEPPALRAPIVAFAGGVAGGFLLAAVSLVPLGEMILNSGELEERTSANPDKTPAKYLAMLFLPDYWGRPTQHPLTLFMNLRGFYAGALPLILAVAAVILRPNLERVGVALFGAGALSVVVGMPVAHHVVNALPVFSTVHNGRMVIYFLLAVAVLAAYAVHDLTGRERRPARERWVARVALVLLCVPLVWLAVGRPSPGDLGRAAEVAWLFADAPDERTVIRLASLLLWLTFAGAGVLVLLARVRGRMGARAFGLAAAAIVAVDLFRIGVGLNPAIDQEHARPPVTGAIEYLQSRRPARFAAANEPGIFAPVTPNVAMDLDLYDARGYDYPTAKRYSKLWKRAVFPEESFAVPFLEAPVNERSLRAFSLLSVSDILNSLEDEPLRAPGLELAYDGDDARVYSNANALPRAFLVGGTRVVPREDDQLNAVLARDFDGRREAIIEEPLGGLDRPGLAGAARIVEYESDRVVIEAGATRRALLVLTDVHFPGWKVTVDGREVPLQRVNYLMRGVPLWAGSHRVEFRYEPASWRIGWIASLVGLVLLLGVVGVSTASRLRSGRERAPADAGEGRARP